LPTRISDLEIEAKVGGNSLDRFTVSASSGFYRSIDNTILWDKTTKPNFVVVEPSGGGIVSFTLASYPLSTLLSSGRIGNELTVDVSVKAKRFSDANVPEEITSSVSKTIRINSNITLNGKSLYFTGPFSNQGPIPPRADQNTTYTIVWTATNTLNDVSDAVVRAVLPGYVTWVGNISPTNESVTYNSSTREVDWNVGSIKAGAGLSGLPREVAFQVSIIPSLSQRGTSPIIVGPAAITGTDRFTGATLNDSATALSTSIADYFMQSGNATLVEP
jgi:hypothetical protein